MLNIILAVAILALGGYMMFAQLQKGKRCSEAATAVIVGREKNRRRGSRGLRTSHYSPIVEFTVNEETVRAVADVESVFSTRYKDGDSLEIRYNPQKNEEIVVQGQSFRSGVLGGAFLILVGLGILYFAIK